MLVRCRKCRQDLVVSSSETFYTAHGEPAQGTQTFQQSSCGSEQLDTSWFINESTVPWILAEVNKSQWTKGKLNCPKCGARVGGFDFVSRTKCSCGLSVLPPTHLVKSKVDHVAAQS